MTGEGSGGAASVRTIAQPADVNTRVIDPTTVHFRQANLRHAYSRTIDHPSAGRRRTHTRRRTVMGGLSWWHWLIIAAAFILLFGARRLPDAARGLGRSLRILKSEVSAMHAEDNQPATADASTGQPVDLPRPAPTRVG
jgi:sec-independent protein translocase protein TatA